MQGDASGFDIDEVIKSAVEQRIPLQEIALFYKNLTESELAVMNEHCLVKSQFGETVIASFPESGVPFFPNKIVSAYYLGA